MRFILVFSLLLGFCSAYGFETVDLRGELNVSPAGALTYEVPIELPRGPGGFQPSLSFLYNSGGPNGLLGVGWAIRGLPAITRCNSNLAQDGNIRSVRMLVDDSYCLDGAKLIQMGWDTGGYSLEYRTEIENFQRIFGSNWDPTGPESFTVHTKNGMLFTFGGTSNSRVKAQANPATMIWALSSARDINGNLYEVEYFNDVLTGEYYPTKIQYGRNIAGPSGFPYSVEFFYETRPDTSISLRSDARFVNTMRLKNIRTYSGMTQIYSYWLNYQLSARSGKSIVTDIGVTSGDGSQSLLPLSFEWNTNTPRYTTTGIFPEATLTTEQSLPAVYSAVGGGSGAGVSGSGIYNLATTQWLSGDFNGDGISDFIQPGLGRNSIPVCMGSYNTSGFTCTNRALGFTFPAAGQFIAGDFDGDGLTDFAHVQAAMTTSRICYSLGTGSFSCSLKSITGLSAITGMSPSISSENNQPVSVQYYTGDFNGDGRTDILNIASNNSAVRICYSDTRAGAHTCQNVIFSSFSPWNVVVGDFDGDGITDIAYPKANPSWTTSSPSTVVPALPDSVNVCYFDSALGSFSCQTKNTATGKLVGSCTVSTPICLGMFFSGDFNGDGISDLAQFDSLGNAHIYLLGGRTHQAHASVTWFASYDLSAEKPLMTADLNGDGRSDIIRRASPSTATTLYYSKGDGTFNEFIGPVISQTNALGGNFTGDRTTVVLGVDKTVSTAKVYLNPPGVSDVITKVTSGLGANEVIGYSLLTTPSIHTKSTGSVYPIVDIQSASIVVTHLAKDTGLGTTTSKSYAYSGAKRHVKGYGFLGFSNVLATNITGLTSLRTFYSQNFPYIGLVDKTQEWAKPQPSLFYVMVREIQNTYENVPIVTGGSMGIRLTTRYLVNHKSSKNTVYDWDTSIWMDYEETVNTFDSYGNITKSTVAVKINDDAYPFSIAPFKSTKNFTLSNYDGDPRTNPENWYLGRVDGVSVTNGGPSAALTTETTGYTYDSKHRILSETREPLNPTLNLQTSYTYDVFGNILTKSVQGTGVATRTETSTYDLYGVGLTSRTNPMGHSESYTYDARFGKVSQLTDANSLTTTWTFDKMGRTVAESRPDGTTRSVVYGACPSSCNAGEVFYVQVSRTGQGDEYYYYDLYAREVRKKTFGFSGSPIYENKLYDVNGRLAGKSDKSYSGTPSYTQYTYDTFGRLLTETNPDSSQKTWSYSGRNVSITNALGQTKTIYKDELGKTTSVVDDSGSSVWFSYDGLGRLKEIKDQNFNTTEIGYDALGGKAYISDPNSGSWTFTHNAVGELTSVTDAKSQTATMTYDLLGRRTGRVTTDFSTSWTYDTALNGVGKIASMSSTNGHSRSFSYDSFSRLNAVTTNMDTAYVMSTVYDSAGRVQKLTYPNGFAVKNLYDAQGILVEVQKDSDSSTIWKLNSQNAMGRPLAEEIGSGIITTKTYHPTKHLLTSAYAVPASGPAIQNLVLGYNSVGSLSARSDLVDHILGTTIAETYGYDNLNRLTSASGPSPESISYDYDGNILSKNGVGSYSYSSGPTTYPIHGVKETGTPTSYAMTYDSNGNVLTSGRGRVFTWNSFNKPTTVSNSLVGYTYSYDGDHEQFKEEKSTCKDYLGSISSTCVKYSINPNLVAGAQFEKEVNGSITSYRSFIYAGSGYPVAVYTTRSDSSTSMRYLHRDHLGSVNVVTNETGGVVERLSYDAFGKRRNVNGSPDPSNLLGGMSLAEGHSFQEHMDEGGMGLINMSGRIYDPELGRFMSADPVNPNALDLQGLNRYSYVHNDPVSSIDPTGYWRISIGNIIDLSDRGIKSDALGINVNWGPTVGALLDPGTTAAVFIYNNSGENERRAMIFVAAAVATYFTAGAATPYFIGLASSIGASAAVGTVAAGAVAGAVGGALYSVGTTGRVDGRMVMTGAMLGATMGFGMGYGAAAVQQGALAASAGVAARGLSSWMSGNQSWEAFAAGNKDYFHTLDGPAKDVLISTAGLSWGAPAIKEQVGMRAFSAGTIVYSGYSFASEMDRTWEQVPLGWAIGSLLGFSALE